jgi:hypothetical protein
MKRDFFFISVGMFTVGLIAWLLLANPPELSRLHRDTYFTDDADLKLVTDRSPHMRNER